MKAIIQALLLSMSASLPVYAAQEADIRLAFADGRVTLTANDVLASEVLAEWARVGGTLVVGTDRLPLTKLSVVLEDVDEQSALQAVIGSSIGFVTADRTDGSVGASRFGRLVIVPATKASAETAPANTSDTVPPEARFAFPTPTAAGSLDDPDSVASRALRVRTSSLPEGRTPAVMPEIQFQYPGPTAAAPGESAPEPTREDKNKSQQQ